MPMFSKIKTEDGKTLSLIWDGKTIWVNNEYTLLGRFSAKCVEVAGLYVEGSEPFGKPRRAEWYMFAAAMWEYHRVELPDPKGMVEFR